MGDGAGRRDAAGLEAVYLAHRPELLRFLTARLRDAHAAEEVLQELWFKLGTARGGPVAAPLGYLYRAALNAALDRRRGEARTAARERGYTDATVEGGLALPIDGTPAADAALIARQRLARVTAALDALPPRTAAIFRRCRFEGQGQRVIAAAEGISVSAVEKHVATAMRAALAALAEDDAPPRRPDVPGQRA